MKTSESAAVIIGGIALFLAMALATVELVREGFGLAAIPLIGAVVWRELVFSGLRAKMR